jgi:transposase-like protein
LVKRVARSYTPSEKAEALEHAAAHGVSAAADTFSISRFSIYDWQRKLKMIRYNGYRRRQNGESLVIAGRCTMASR